MVRITTVSPDLLVKRSGRRSPEADVQIAQFRELLSVLSSTSDAFLIEPDPSDKPITVRARFLRTARSMGTEVVIRKHPKGFVVGLMTPGTTNPPRHLQACPEVDYRCDLEDWSIP